MLDFKKTIIILVLMFFVLSGSAFANKCYESDMNPAVFKTWTLINVTPINPLFVRVIVENPDENAEIGRADLLVNIEDEHITAFRYMKGDKLHIFKFNEKTECYERVYDSGY